MLQMKDQTLQTLGIRAQDQFYPYNSAKPQNSFGSTERLCEAEAMLWVFFKVTIFDHNKILKVKESGEKPEERNIKSLQGQAINTHELYSPARSQSLITAEPQTHLFV